MSSTPLLSNGSRRALGHRKRQSNHGEYMSNTTAFRMKSYISFKKPFSAKTTCEGEAVRLAPCGSVPQLVCQLPP